MNNMGLKSILAKRNFKNRVKRKSNRIFARRASSGSSEFAIVDDIGRRVLKYGQKAYAITQRRKETGKEILKERAKKLLGDSYLAFGREARSLFKEEKYKRKR